jgi:hypothetical protein
MRRRRFDRRFTEIMLGLLLLIAGLALFANDPVLPLILGIVGFYLLARQFDRRSSTARRSAGGFIFGDEADEAPLPPKPNTDQVYEHALDAVRHAGLDPAEVSVLPTDIGLMVFSADQDPTIFRTRPILDDVDYIQPFVELRLPSRARGRIRFEILDTDGQVLFIHEENHEFERGRNLISPAARLPIHDAQAMHGDWQLRVSADGVLIAEHSFGWQESTSRVMRRHLKEDGELSNEVRAMIAENRLQRMSLDELLSDQDTEEEEPPSQQASRS